MYIIYKEGKFAISDQSDFAVAQIAAPIYIENREEKQLVMEQAENGA